MAAPRCLRDSVGKRARVLSAYANAAPLNRLSLLTPVYVVWLAALATERRSASKRAHDHSPTCVIRTPALHPNARGGRYGASTAILTPTGAVTTTTTSNA